MPIEFEFSREGYMSRCHDSCRIFGHVLRERFDRLRRDGSAIIGLSEVDADKTMRLLTKLWRQRSEELFETGSLGSGSALKNRIVAFPVEPNHNDKHGHRIAFPPAGETPQGPTRNLKPVLDVIYSFDAKLPPSERILVVHQVEENWGRIKRLEPQVSSVALFPLVQSGRIDARDIRFVTRVGVVCGILNEWEIQAVGRHESAEASCESLLDEFKRWHEMAEGAVRLVRLAAPEAASRAIWQCWSFGLECARKAGLVLPGYGSYVGDRELYDVAVRKLRDELNNAQNLSQEEEDINAQIAHLLDTVQPPSATIWEDPRVSMLEFPAFCCWTFSIYFCGALKELNSFKGTTLQARLSSVQRKDIEDAFEDIKRCVHVPRGSRPSTFTPGWWASIMQNDGGLSDRCVEPTKLWNGLSELSEFVDGSEAVLSWLWENFIEQDVAARRLQKVD